MERQRQALSNELTAGLAKRGGKVHAVLEIVRIRRTKYSHRHLVHQRFQRVLEDFRFYRIEVSVHVSSSPTVITTLSHASRLALQFGGTNIVVSYSSMISGPGRAAVPSSCRASNGTLRSPIAAPKYADRSPDPVVFPSLLQYFPTDAVLHAAA